MKDRQYDSNYEPILDRGGSFPLSASEHEFLKLQKLPEVEMMLKQARSRVRFLIRQRSVLVKRGLDGSKN